MADDMTSCLTDLVIPTTGVDADMCTYYTDYLACIPEECTTGFDSYEELTALYCNGEPSSSVG